MPTIGELVCQARLAKDVTQADLARDLGVSRSRIAAIEQDEETPTAGEIGDIEAALDLTRGQILADAGAVEGP